MTASSSLRAVVASTVILCLTSQTVGAAPPISDPTTQSEADSHAAKAIEAFGAGRYDEAVTEFSAAFTLDQNPNHLFNIGRVHEEAGDFEAAVDYYKRFVAQPGVEIDHRAGALERIDVLERAIAAQQDDRAPAPVPEVEPAPAITPAQPVDRTDEPGTDPRKGQRSTGWALLGIGGAALVAGAVTTGLTASTSSQLADATDPAERERLVARGRTLAPTSDALLIAGGTLALVGLIVALTALPKRGDRRTATLPYAGTGSGGITMIHRF